MSTPGSDGSDYHDAMTTEAVALASSIVKAMYEDPGGPKVTILLESIISDLARELPDGPPEAIIEALGRRGAHVTVMVEVMARMVVTIMEAATREGIVVHLDALSTPLDVLDDLEDPFPKDDE